MTKIAAFAAVLLMSTSALAQSGGMGNWVEIEDDSLQVSQLNLTVDALEDMDLYDPAGTKIGEVDDVYGADASQATAVAIELEDGSAPDKSVIVEIAALSVVDGRLVTQMTAADLAAMQPFEDD